MKYVQGTGIAQSGKTEWTERVSRDHRGTGRFAVWMVLLPLLAAGGPALAQATDATLNGAVTDAGGAAVAGAHVMVQNAGTGASQTVDSNNSGIYTVGQLLPGTYTVTTSRDGFQTSVDKGVVITVDQVATLNVALRVGDVKETVTVSAAAALINTSNAEISQVVDQHAIKELPLNGRDPSSLVLLSSGVTNVLNTNVGVLQTETTFPTESGASAGGGRQGSTYYLLDGAPNMDTYVLLAAPFPNADATQEFRVISNNFDSRYGYSPSAIVTIQTKSGTNAFHGGAFEFLRNTDLNAADYFSHNVSTLKRNQFGGYIGGPILKDKLFFFVNYQGTRAIQAGSANSTFTPTAAMLNGDFSAVPATLTGGFATVAGKPNQISPTLFDPASVKIATTALPLGQTPSSGLVEFLGPSNQQHFDEGTARIDYNLSQRQHLFVRSFTDYFNQIGSAIKGNIVGNAIVTGKPSKYFNEAAGYDTAISPSLLNTFTLFWNQLQVMNSGEGLDTNGNSVCLSKYINVAEIPGACYLEGLSVNSGSNGFTTNYNEPTGEARTTYGLSDNISKTIGNHTLSIGGNIWRQFAQENSQYPATPIVNFSNQFTGFGLADFLLGDVNQFTQGAGEIASVKGWQFGLYGQDQYRVRPNFTLTLGVRWDPSTPPGSTGGRGSSFRAGQQSTRFPNAPLGEIFPGDAGLDAALQPTDYAYVQPRVGFNWQPSTLPHTVIRGGFGLFTSPLPYSSYNHVADIAPFSPTFVLNASPTNRISFSNIAASFPGGVSPFPPFASLSFKPPTNSAFAGPVNLGATFSQNFRLGTTESWNLSVDQQFSSTFAAHIAYVASESYHLAQVLDNNPGNPAAYVASGGAADPRFNPLFGQILADTSLGTSPYQSLQAGVEERLWHGLQLQSNFTWSKVIDIASTGNISFSGGLPDPFDIRHNRGISDLNVPLISITNFVYTTPLLEGHSVLIKNTLGGWEISPIYTLQTGRPFGIVGGANGSNNSGALQGGDRADVVPDTSVQERQGSKQNWILHYIPTGAFQANAPGTFGNSKRNLFTAPPTNTADIAFAKNWEVRERYGLQFRWEMFNAFNHTSFATPSNDPTNPSSFGQITSTGPIGARLMQGALKATF